MKGGELSESSRMGLAVRIAMALPPGQISLPRGDGAVLADEYGVLKNYPYLLWGKVSDQLAARLTLDLGTTKRGGWPSILTLTKTKLVVHCNVEHRSLTLRQYQSHHQYGTAPALGAVHGVKGKK